jgi:hypothetical protein
MLDVDPAIGLSCVSAVFDAMRVTVDLGQCIFAVELAAEALARMRTRDASLRSALKLVGQRFKTQSLPIGWEGVFEWLLRCLESILFCVTPVAT